MELIDKEKIEIAKEQLKAADAIAYKLPDSAYTIRTTVYAIFPELKESDDEKIRKDIISHFKETRWVTTEGAEKAAKYIAWLEKQGEQKPSEWNEEDEENLQIALDMVEWYGGKNEDKSRTISDWLKSLRPQPKQEWNKEDEKKHKSVLKYAEEVYEKRITLKPIKCIRQSPNSTYMRGLVMKRKLTVGEACHIYREIYLFDLDLSLDVFNSKKEKDYFYKDITEKMNLYIKGDVSWNNLCDATNYYDYYERGASIASQLRLVEYLQKKGVV